MSDLLSIAASGLRGYRAALDNMSENVANASSPGYARRDVQLTGIDPDNSGPLVRPPVSGFGVDVTGLRRAHDIFLAADARGAQSDSGRLASTKTWLSEIETTLTAGGNSIGHGITAFYNTAQGLANEPGSAVQRAQFLNAADIVATHFRDASGAFDRTAAAIGKEAGATVATVNGLTAQLATLNGHLRRTDTGNAASAGLQDERDRVLTELAKSVAIDVIEGDRGTVTVKRGDAFGATLVDGTAVTSLAAKGATITLAKAGGDVGSEVTGGSLAGTLAGARRLTETRAALDGLANDFAATVNAAHGTGVDLSGAPGAALFATTAVQTTASPANNGLTSIDTTLADGAAPVASGYTLRYDGTAAAWTLARADGTASNTSATALTLDGLTVTPAGQPANADLFTLTPRTGAAGIALRITDPTKVAAADPWIAGPSFANAGKGIVAVTVDPTATGLPKLAGYQLHMTDASHFEILDPATSAVLVAAQPYVAGAPIAGAGFRVTLSGTPATGDRFTIAAASNASGDAGAIDRLIATRTTPTGTANFEDRFDGASSRLSTALANSKSAAAAAASALTVANAAQEALSGVPLDSEAVDLVRFQQAYQASAKVIQTANDLFNSLLQLH